jgi:putative FmdB family regulatory protein
MPIYEYECGKCGVFETSQRISEAPLTKCPTCRRKVRRLISSTSFQLKGSGWYVTDYARGGADKKAAKDGEAKADTKSESSTDSTPESKPKPEAKSKKADTKSGASSSAPTAS